MPQSLRTREAARHPRASPVPSAPKTKIYDSGRWTGAVDKQKREARMYLAAVAVVVAIVAPLAVWIGLTLARGMGL